MSDDKPDIREGPKNTLFLHLDSLSGSVEINEPIHCRTLTLRQVALHHQGSTPSGTDHPAMILVIPSLGPNQINSNLGRTGIPILYNGSNSCTSPNITMTLNKTIPKKFKYFFADEHGDPVVNNHYLFCQLWFEYDKND